MYRPTRGFPTILYKPAGHDKNPIFYPERSRRADNYIEWLEEITEGRNLNILTNKEVPMNIAEAAQDKFEQLWEKELGPLQAAKEELLDTLQKHDIKLPEKKEDQDDSNDVYIEDLMNKKDEL